MLRIHCLKVQISLSNIPELKVMRSLHAVKLMCNILFWDTCKGNPNITPHEWIETITVNSKLLELQASSSDKPNLTILCIWSSLPCSILKLWSHLLRIPSIASKPKSTEFRTEELMERTGGQSGGAVKKICNYNSLALRYCSSSETIKIKLKDASKCRKPSVKSNKRWGW